MRSRMRISKNRFAPNTMRRALPPNWLNGQIDELKSRVVASEKAVEDYRSANNLTVSQGVTRQRPADHRSQQQADRRARADRRGAAQSIEQVQHIAKSGGDPGGINAAISSEMITKLRTQYADIAKNEADLSSKYGARHPLVANVRAQLRDTQRLINEEIRRILESTQARLRRRALARDVAAAEPRPAAGRVQRPPARRRCACANCSARPRPTARSMNPIWPATRKRRRRRAWRCRTRGSSPRPASRSRPSSPKTMLILGLALMLGLGVGSRAGVPRRLSRRPREDAGTGREAIQACRRLPRFPLIGARELAGRRQARTQRTRPL